MGNRQFCRCPPLNKDTRLRSKAIPRSAQQRLSLASAYNSDQPLFTALPLTTSTREPVFVLKLLLVRHGQSVGNVEGRMEGVRSTELTALGEQQSLRLGQHLAAAGWYPSQIYTSPLTRSTATLAWLLQGIEDVTQTKDTPLAASAPGAAIPAQVTFPPGQTVPIGRRDELKEYDAGIFTGLTWAEARDRHPDLCHRLETSLDWQPIPQAETLEQGQARAQRFIANVLSQHGNGDRVLVISHHWILQQVIACLMGCDRAWGLPMANTAMFEFWLDRDRWHQAGPNRLNTELWRIKRFNDTVHLGEWGSDRGEF